MKPKAKIKPVATKRKPKMVEKHEPPKPEPPKAPPSHPAADKTTATQPAGLGHGLGPEAYMTEQEKEALKSQPPVEKQPAEKKETK